MRYEPIRSATEKHPMTDVLGVYIAYEEHELNALRHLLEFLRKRYRISEDEIRKKRKRVLLRHPICQILDKRVSLFHLLDEMYVLEDFPAVVVYIGFRFVEDRTTFRVYQRELAQTTDVELQTAREIYEIVGKEYFPDKEKMN